MSKSNIIALLLHEEEKQFIQHSINLFVMFMHTIKPISTATLKKTKKSLQDQLSLNAGQKYC